MACDFGRFDLNRGAKEVFMASLQGDVQVFQSIKTVVIFADIC